MRTILHKLAVTFIALSVVGEVRCLPRPEVSEQMINDVLQSIRRVVRGQGGGGDRWAELHDLSNQAPATSSTTTTDSTATTVTSSVASTPTTIKISTEISKSSTITSTTTTTTTTTVTTTKTTTTTKTISKRVGSSEQEELCDTVPNNSLLRNGLGSTGFTWPEGKIPYEISADFNETQKATIESAIEYYNQEFSGCLRWVEHSDEQNFVIFENTGTCSSRIELQTNLREDYAKFYNHGAEKAPTRAFSRIGVAFYPLPISQTINLGRCSHLLGHIKHEMMHTVGFYHEHSRSDRDKYIQIEWNNIPPEYQVQFTTYRWTVGYGEEYDYESIMHYSSRAFVRDYSDKNMRSITPRDASIDPDTLGFKPDLSDIDKIKIRKMYKCAPYDDYKVRCSNDDECGMNEYCAAFVGECRTKLPDGSVCFLDQECLHHCGGGVCAACEEDGHCAGGGGGEQYCAYKYLPAIQNECAGFCDSFCLFSAQCGGSCTTCTWSFTCQK